MTKHGGYETAERYPFAELAFLGIANIHEMRHSLRALDALVCKSDSSSDNWQWLAKVEGTRWLGHVRRVLAGAIRVAAALARGRAVLVHCSDGWDRTAQICALSQLLVDPHYRTTAGFAALVEKEFQAAGHRFRSRLGHLLPPPEEVKAGKGKEGKAAGKAHRQTSPVFLQVRRDTVRAERGRCSPRGLLRIVFLAAICFVTNDALCRSATLTALLLRSPTRAHLFATHSPLQFIDAVFQLVNMLPTAFEFNSALLLFVASHVHSCRFSSFTADCEAEAIRTGVELQRSPVNASLWRHVLAEEPGRFVNELYRAVDRPLVPPVAAVMRHVTLWSDYFLRWSPSHSIPSLVLLDPAVPLVSSHDATAGAAIDAAVGALLRPGVRSGRGERGSAVATVERSLVRTDRVMESCAASIESAALEEMAAALALDAAEERESAERSAAADEKRKTERATLDALLGGSSDSEGSGLF